MKRQKINANIIFVSVQTIEEFHKARNRCCKEWQKDMVRMRRILKSG
jgi:hypothetical protein